jgi:ABC-type lipoprotein export system ATPase subunit
MRGEAQIVDPLAALALDGEGRLETERSEDVGIERERALDVAADEVDVAEADEHVRSIAPAARPATGTGTLALVGQVVRARGLVKSYGVGGAARNVLDGAELVVEPGELVAIVGRSGSGKSTLLHLLGALDVPDAGSVEVAGQRIDGRPERELTAFRRRRVGFVFQAFHLLPELTGFENVLLPARLAGDGRAAAARTRTLLRDLGLAEQATRLPATLSGGEQQRLAVVRSLVNDPPLILADEPTGNLDDESGLAVLQLLRTVAAGSRAVVMVTHDHAATERADRVLRLEHGRLVE